MSVHSLISVTPWSHCLLSPVVFHPSWHTRHFPCSTRCQRGNGEKMTYSLLIVSFTAQRRARSLIDSSSVRGGVKHGGHPSLSSSSISRCWKQKGLKYKTDLKVGSWETLNLCSDLIITSVLSYAITCCSHASHTGFLNNIVRDLTCLFYMQICTCMTGTSPNPNFCTKRVNLTCNITTKLTRTPT